MKIGVGVTFIKGIREQFYKNWFWKMEAGLLGDADFTNVVTIDDPENRKGVAHQKNECLRNLKDCDHIFLFDDDTWPIHPDWYKVFIDAAAEAGQEHLMYIAPFTHSRGENPKPTDCIPFKNLLKYEISHGCMLYFTKKCIEVAGGFDERFKIYGYEHSELSRRIYNIGLTSAPFLTIPDVQKYIHACDFDGYSDGTKEQGNSTDGLDLTETLRQNSRLYIQLQHSKTKIPL